MKTRCSPPTLAHRRDQELQITGLAVLEGELFQRISESPLSAISVSLDQAGDVHTLHMIAS